MRKDGVLSYVISDHLGSTSLVTDSSGAVINQTKYKAWGETRYSSGTEQTKYTYTGQYSYVTEFGLHFYNARWYDSSLSRFAQADTIVTDGSQGLDRYSYTFNNPLRYTDPSGHMPCQSNYCDPRWLSVAPPTKPNFEILPVEDPTWIQWFGGTEFAYDDHEDFVKGRPNFNYDGYCQGYHCGLDFGGSWGDPVFAGIHGKVIDSGKGDGGYYIIIEVGDYHVLYQALDGDFKVSIGDTVSPATLIAGIGNHSANPNGGNTHLHLEVRHSNTRIGDYKNRIANPLLFMSTSQYEFLNSKVEASPIENITFHSSSKDPLNQISPIVRGGPVLWDD